MDDDAARVAAELRALEPIFHRSPPGSTRAVFEAMTAPDFWEVGASGRVYQRDEVLNIVEGRYARGDADEPLAVSDFAAREIAPDTYLVTYALDQAGRASRRATVWARQPHGWAALYHQGTLATP